MIKWKIATRALTLSPSTRRVWIEMSVYSLHNTTCKSHPPHGGCGLKFTETLQKFTGDLSPSTRRVWIEICRMCLEY